MKPVATLRSRCRRYNETSWLEVITITGALSPAVILSQTVKPSRSKREHHVEENHIRAQSTDCDKRRFAILGLSDDVVTIRLEQRPGKRAETRMIVDNQQGGLHLTMFPITRQGVHQ